MTTTLPSPPFITVSGIPNFRDLGGYPLADSTTHSVRTSFIYRCAEPSTVTPAGIDTLKALGIKRFYDLRSVNEIERSIAAGRGKIVEWEGCERVFVPVFQETDYSPEALAVRFKDYTEGVEGFTRAYIAILNSAGEHSYRTILLHIANEPEKPLVVHCTAGKDRTGVLCALLLSLAGVEDKVIAYEYALTEIGLPEEWKQGVIKHLMSMNNPALENNMSGALNMIGARAEAMRATLDIIRDDFGGAEKYMTERCGLTNEEVQRVKSNLIVKEPALHQELSQNL